MKASVLILGVWLTFYQVSLGQDCPEHNVNLSNQVQVDAFIEMYPNCTELAGSLNISGVSITDLTALRNIKKVNGSFFVSGCHSLKDFTGLEGLEEVNDFVRIQTNDSIQSFKGLDNLRIIRGEFMYISRLESMEILEGFPALDTIMGNLQVFQMTAMTQIDAFHNLRYAGNRIMAYQNPVLKEINGFDILEQVMDLRLDDNDELESISAFDRPLLISDWIVIRNNPNLSQCSIESICMQLDNQEVRKSFGGNATGCASLVEVMEECTPTSTAEVIRQSIKIFPNPAYSEIHLEVAKELVPWPSNTMVVATDGRMYHLKSTNGVLQVAGLPAGFYFGKSVIQDVPIRFSFVKL